jgi:hypothetical protein
VSGHQQQLEFVKAIKAAAAGLDECKVQAGEFAFEHDEGQADIESCIRVELGQGIRAVVEYVQVEVVSQLSRPEEAGRALVASLRKTLEAGLPWEQAWLKEGK